MKPINSHVLIEPLKFDSFMATQKETYQEIGIVVDIAEDLTSVETLGSGQFTVEQPAFKKGDKVYFDAWLGKKYPKEGTDSYYWLIRYQDVVAYEPISK